MRSDPCDPPPAWWRPPRSANSQPGGGRDDQLAGVRVRQRRPGPLASLRMVEDRGVATRAGRGEAKLGTVTARDGLVPLAPEDDVDGFVAVEPPGEHRRIVVGVDHARAVRGGHEVFGEDVLQPGDVGHGRLAVVGAENDRVALEELVRPARGLDQRADGHVAPGERGVRCIGSLGVRGVVVVREVVDEEVEAVPRHEPAADRDGVGVDRSARPVAHRERCAGRVRLEQVVEEEPARPVGRTSQEGNRRAVLVPASVAGDVHGGGRQPGVLQRLVEGHRVLAQVAVVEPVDRVDQRLPRACCQHGAERRAVLDEPLLSPVVPDEMRDLVHIRVRSRRERREADGRQRREGRDGAAIAAVLGEQRERGCRLALERVLEHRRRETVDDNEDQLLPDGQSLARVRRPA